MKTKIIEFLEQGEGEYILLSIIGSGKQCSQALKEAYESLQEVITENYSYRGSYVSGSYTKLSYRVVLHARKWRMVS